MNDKLNHLIAQIKDLEREVITEIHDQEKKFGFEIREKKVRFTDAVLVKHRKTATSLWRYLRKSPVFSIVTAPMIWFCVFPIMFLDAVAEVYQFVCFPAYGIPKVRREDYIIIDRGRLKYLNPMERFNCVYCGYVNGLIAYVQEIAGRTEQYWCPIKHALNLKTRHSRYQYFLDYGDAEQYHKRIEQARRDFEDIKKADKTQIQRKS